MGRPRSELASILKGLTPNVYFQPPENQKLEYPCIVYTRDDVESAFADNIPVRTTIRYQVTVIDRDPDSTIPEQVAALPMCSFERFFTADHLNHDVYNLFY